MPYWTSNEVIMEYMQYDLAEIDEVTEETAISVMHKRYTMIADILPVVSDEKLRSDAIEEASVQYGISKQTIRSYLWKYLVAQDKKALAPIIKKKEKPELSEQEKNVRWALNKFFYTTDKNSLSVAYTMMLQAKYCDNEGKIKESYPTFYQFRYFYRKTKKKQNYEISRNGLKAYQRDKRPCVGDSVQSFAPAPGTGMFDSTICDIYLVDNTRTQIIGRPILTACIDAYSGLCNGYTVTLEGGLYSLRELMLNIVADKVKHCEDFGIKITNEDWPSYNCLPGRLVTDRGKEYTSETFAQLAELGVLVTNLPSFRAELKSSVERIFKYTIRRK
jgi:transposase InsO family protein